MVELIKRCPEYVMGYKAYCQELYDNHVTYFRPTNPKNIDDEWFFVRLSPVAFIGIIVGIYLIWKKK